MIQREKIEGILKLPLEERRKLLRVLQESLPGKGEDTEQSPNGIRSLPLNGCFQWPVATQGRGNTAARADDIMCAEIDKSRGLTTN